jgi:hypothetical protein
MIIYNLGGTMKTTFDITTFLTTIGGGLVLFILSQLALKTIIEPIQEHRKIVGKIVHALILYANVYSNPIRMSEQNLKNEALKNERDMVSLELRKLAGELIASIQVIPFYSFFSYVFVIPRLKSIEEARGCLIGLSNSLWKTDAEDNIYQEKRDLVAGIYKALRIIAIK